MKINETKKTQLARLFEAAYCCSTVAWRRSVTPGDNGTYTDVNDTPTTGCDGGDGKDGGGHSGASPFGVGGQFRSEKLADSVKNHLGSARIWAAAQGNGGGGGGGEGGVSAQGLKVWVSERAPLLHHCLSTFMHTRCFLYGDARSLGVKGERFRRS